VFYNDVINNFEYGGEWGFKKMPEILEEHEVESVL
jgi:hypothetical protein